MYEKIKLQSKELLNGRMFFLFFLISSKFIFILLDLSAIISAFYFFVEKKAIFGVDYAYCGIICLFLFSVFSYFCFKYGIFVKTKFYSFFNSKTMSKGYSFRYVMKYFLLQFYKTIKIFECSVFYFLPATVMTYTFFCFGKNGINFFITVVFIVAVVGTFVYGLICFFREKQKYYFYDYCFFKNRNRRIKDIVDDGNILCDGRCNTLFKTKIKLFKYLFADIFIIPAVFYIPLSVLIKYGTVCNDDNKKSKAITYLASENYKSSISRSEK